MIARKRKILWHFGLLLFLAAAIPHAPAQTDCAEGNGVLDVAPPKDMTPQELIQKFGAEETRVKEARTHYTYTQDLMVQTLNGNAVDGQFHEVSTISYDDKGKRLENVTFAEQSGQQNVDDLDTYVFHVEPKKEEKDKRYFQGRIWVDNRDFQIVKVCGKSVPQMIRKKKNQPQDIRPTFVGYRQLVDGFWFPAYVRVDDTLHFSVEAVRVREIVKFAGYKRAGVGASAKP
jgi:hypothetical protein